MRRIIYVSLVFMALLSCRLSYSDTNRYVSYFDESQTTVKSCGFLDKNDLEQGDWFSLSRDGDTTAIGNYSHGMLDGCWLYSLPGISKQICWKRIKTNGLSYPIPFDGALTGKMIGTDDESYYCPSMGLLITASVLNDMDSVSTEAYFQNTLSGFSHEVNILDTSSIEVGSKHGKYFVDQFELKYPGRDTSVFQIALYKRTGATAVCVVTCVSNFTDRNSTKFVASQIFSHVYVKGTRLNWPHDEEPTF